MIWSAPIMYHCRTLGVYTRDSQWGAWDHPFYGPHSWRQSSLMSHIAVGQTNGWEKVFSHHYKTSPSSVQVLRFGSGVPLPSGITVRQSFTDWAPLTRNWWCFKIVVIQMLNKSSNRAIWKISYQSIEVVTLFSHNVKTFATSFRNRLLKMFLKMSLKFSRLQNKFLLPEVQIGSSQ